MDMEPLIGGLTALIVMIGMSTPIIVIGLVYYYKKKLEHRQVIAAIEKGVPVSELNLNASKEKKSDGPGWIKDQSKGTTLLIIGIGIVVAFWLLLRGAETDTQHIFLGPLDHSDSIFG